jgi:hypothetical protein
MCGEIEKGIKKKKGDVVTHFWYSLKNLNLESY